MFNLKSIITVIVLLFVSCSLVYSAPADDNKKIPGFNFTTGADTKIALMNISDSIGYIILNPDKIGRTLPQALVSPLEGLTKEGTYDFLLTYLLSLPKKHTAIRNRKNSTIKLIELSPETIDKEVFPVDEVDPDITQIPVTDEVIKVKLNLKSIDAESLEVLAKAKLNTWAVTKIDKGLNSITFIDTARNVSKIMQYIESDTIALNKRISTLSSTVLKCVNNSPELVAKQILQGLNVDPDVAARMLAKPKDGQTSTTTNKQDLGTASFKFRLAITIEGSNISLTGTESELAYARKVWSELEKDAQAAAVMTLGDLEYRSYFCKNAMAKDVIKSMAALFYSYYKYEMKDAKDSIKINETIKTESYYNEIIKEEVVKPPAESDKGTPAGDALVSYTIPPSIQGMPELTKLSYSFSLGGVAGKVTFIEDGRNNGIVYLCKKEHLSLIEFIINDLDKPNRQVFIDVLLMEISLNDEFKWGVGARIGNDFIQGVAFRGKINPTSIEDVVTKVTAFDPNTALNVTTETMMAPDNNLNAFVFNYKSMAAILEHIQSKTTVTTIASPKILTTNNRLAGFAIQEAIPVIVVNTSNLNNNAVVTNSTSTAINVVLVEQKIIVLPHINGKDENILMELGQTFQSVVSYVTQGDVTFPLTVTRETRSTVVIKDGYTLMVGGVIQDRKSNTKSVFPIIGMIPLIGELFNVTYDLSNKTEIVMFLTPHVVSDNDQQTEVMKKQGQKFNLVPAGGGIPHSFKPYFKQ